MNRQDLRNPYPLHRQAMASPAPRTDPHEPSAWGVMAGMICRGALIAIMVAIALPVLRTIILWVLAHG